MVRRRLPLRKKLAVVALLIAATVGAVAQDNPRPGSTFDISLEGGVQLIPFYSPMTGALNGILPMPYLQAEFGKNLRILDWLSLGLSGSVGGLTWWPTVAWADIGLSLQLQWGSLTIWPRCGLAVFLSLGQLQASISGAPEISAAIGFGRGAKVYIRGSVILAEPGYALYNAGVGYRFAA
jgi:hypothetical protein